nr:hypothetical protein [Candidatus Njordarchaeum guaymaensis]
MEVFLCVFTGDLFVSLATFKSKHLWSKRTHEIVFSVHAAIPIIFDLWFIGFTFQIPFNRLQF